MSEEQPLSAITECCVVMRNFLTITKMSRTDAKKVEMRNQQRVEKEYRKQRKSNGKFSPEKKNISKMCKLKSTRRESQLV